MNTNETAYELADRIEKIKGMPYTVKMLRQQADQIKTQGIALKAYAERLAELEKTHPVKQLSDEEISQFEYQIIRACGLSTANSDINIMALQRIIKEIAK